MHADSDYRFSEEYGVCNYVCALYSQLIYEGCTYHRKDALMKDALIFETTFLKNQAVSYSVILKLNF